MRQCYHQHLDDKKKNVAQIEERKQKAIQLDLKEVKAKKLNLTESMEEVQQKATVFAKHTEVKNGFHLLGKSNALQEKAVGRIRNFKL